MMIMMMMTGLCLLKIPFLSVSYCYRLLVYFFGARRKKDRTLVTPPPCNKPLPIPPGKEEKHKKKRSEILHSHVYMHLYIHNKLKSASNVYGTTLSI